MKKLKYLLFSIIPILLFTSKVNAENAPITPTVENELFMTAFSASSASDDETVWFNKALGENVNISNSNFDVVPLAYYYSLSLPVEANYTYTTSFTISLKYYYDIKLNSNYTFSKNKDKYKYVVYGDHINSYSCSINKDNITNYSNYSIEEIDVSCSYNFKQNVDSEYLSIGLNGQPTWVESGLSAFNGKVTDNLIAYISNVKNLKYSDGSNVIIDQNNKIIDQNNQNTDKLLDSNKENTDKILDSNKDTQNVIKNQFNTCRDSVNLFDGIMEIGGINNKTGNNQENSNLFRSKNYVLVEPNTTYIISNDGVGVAMNVLEYASDKSFIAFTGVITAGKPFTTSSTTRYIRFYRSTLNPDKIQVEKGSSASSYEPSGQICSNKLDEQTKTSKGILGKLSSLFDWLTNKDSADVSGANKIAGYLPPGPLDSIINLPLTFLQNLNTNLSKTCTPLNVPMPYVNKTVQIPCLNTIFNQIDGLPNFWNWVGTIASVMILYRYLIKLYKYYDDLTTLKANFLSDWGSI